MDGVQPSQGYRVTMRRQLLLTTFKQNKTSKIDTKCWSSSLVLLSLNMSCLLHKQQSFIKIKILINTSTANEQHLFSAFFLFWFQWYTEQAFMFDMYLVPEYQVKLCIFLTSFNLRNNINTPQTDTNLLHKYEHLFSWKLAL